MSPRPAEVVVVVSHGFRGELGGSCSCFTPGQYFFLGLSPQ